MNSLFTLRGVLFGVLLVLSCRPEVAWGAGVVSSNWLSPADGLWTEPANWSTSPYYPDNGQPDVADTYNVLIDAAGSPYTVSLVDLAPTEVDSLTISSADATVSTRGSTLVTPLLDIQEGTFLFGWGTRIEDATITGAGNFVFNLPSRGDVPVFDNVTLELATIVPSGSGSPTPRGLRIENGLQVASSGELVLSSRSLVDVVGSQSFDGEGQLVFRGTPNTYQRGALIFAADTTLTIEPNFTIRTEAMSGAIGLEGGTTNAASNINLINYGLLSGEAASEPLEIMNVPQESDATFINYGDVQAIGEGVVVVAGTWSNQGTFRLRDNARLFLGGDFTPDDIGSIDRQGGQIFIAGRVHNHENTITANADTGNIIFGRENFFFPGRQQVIGGTIAAADGAQWYFHGGELVDVAVTADVTIDGSRVYGDLTLDDSVVSLGQVIFEQETIGIQRLAGTGLLQFDRPGTGQIYFGANTELIIENGITIETSGSNGRIRDGMLVNEGLVRSNLGNSLDIESRNFTNRGIIDIAGRTAISAGNEYEWRNEGTIHLRSTGELSLRGRFTSSSLGTIVDEGGKAQLNGTLDLEGNTLDLELLPFENDLQLFGGTLQNGRITSSGDAALDIREAQYTSAIFDNITLATDLFLPGGASGATLRVENGLTLEDVTITMPEGAAIVFQGDTQFLDGTGVLYAPNRPSTSAISIIAGDSLIIGEDVVVRNGTESYRELRVQFQENRGTIIAEAPNSIVTIGTNVGPSVGPLWTNNGTILVEDGAVHFWGNYTVDDLGDLQNPSGTVGLNGNITNHGKTIYLPSNSGRWIIDAEVTGGVIEAGEGTVVELGGLFDSVTLRGDAESHRGSRGSGSFVVRNGFLLDKGRLVINAEDYFTPIDSSPVTFGGIGIIFLNGAPGNSGLGFQDLTLAEGVTVQTGNSGGGSVKATNLMNYGTIAATTYRQTLVIDGGLQNFGTLRSTSDSLLRIDSDSWVNQGIMEIGSRRTYGGFVITSNSFTNSPAGLITGGGYLEMTNAPLVNSGIIAPGIGVGRFELRGDLEMTQTAILAMDVLSPEAIDQLLVFGGVSLDGTLELNVPKPGLLSQGATYEILRSLNAEGISGKFTNPMDQVQVGDALFQINYSPSAVSLTVLNVPEPSALAISMLVCTVFAFRWRRGSIEKHGGWRVG